MVSRREDEILLIPRSGSPGSRLADFYEAEIEKYDVGDLYTHSFSTTAPPAFVQTDYRVVRRDRSGLWGVSLESRIREMDLEEV